MIKELLSLANHLDSRGLRKEADYLDKVIRKIAASPDEALPMPDDGDEGVMTLQMEPGEALMGHDTPFIDFDEENERVRKNQKDTEHSLAQMLSDFFDKDESGAIESSEVSDMLDLFKLMISAYAKKHNQSEEEAREFMMQELADHMGSRIDLGGIGENLY